MFKKRLGIVREHLSPDFLFSAYNFSQMAFELEKIKESKNSLHYYKHRSYIISSIFSGVAFLESTINEVYYVAGDKVLESERIRNEDKIKLAPIWTINKFQKGARILEKYQVALKLLEKELFNEGEEPYQSVKLVIDLRNALVHYSPETIEIILDETNDRLEDLEKKLIGKFETNPLSNKFPVFPANHPEKRAKYPFFPERCLSADCSRWASKSSLAFVNEFFKRIDVKWHYMNIINDLPVL